MWLQCCIMDKYWSELDGLSSNRYTTCRHVYNYFLFQDTILSISGQLVYHMDVILIVSNIQLLSGLTSLAFFSPKLSDYHSLICYNTLIAHYHHYLEYYLSLKYTPFSMVNLITCLIVCIHEIYGCVYLTIYSYILHCVKLALIIVCFCYLYCNRFVLPSMTMFAANSMQLTQSRLEGK